MKKRQSIASSIRNFASDQTGAEVTELAIVLALIVAGAVVAIITLGGKVSSSYASFNSQLP